MDDAEFAVFEPVHVAVPPLLEGLLAHRSGLGPFDQLLGDAAPAPPPLAISTGAETLRTLSGADQAEQARAAGQPVFRIPKMPLRLIPQVAAKSDATPGAPWGVAAVGADHTGDLQGQGVCVAVLDTGIDATHPAFAGLIKDGNYKDFTGTGLEDNVGHGTHCAGIIFGRPIDGARIAVAPGISNVLIGKIADTNVTATTALLSQALTWAVNNGANVISLSIGLDFIGHSKMFEQRGYPPDVALAAALNDYRDYTRFFDRLMATVVSAGAAANSALVIAACGNDSDAESQGVRVPATLPAVAEKVIAVGALGRVPGAGYSVAPFSNTGANLCAPGAAILSAKPGGGTATMSGTSQAAPHVAGIAALWFQKLTRDRGDRPTPDDVRDEMFAAARRDGIAGQDDLGAIGRGLALAPI